MYTLQFVIETEIDINLLIIPSSLFLQINYKLDEEHYPEDPHGKWCCLWKGMRQKLLLIL